MTIGALSADTVSSASKLSATLSLRNCALVGWKPSGYFPLPGSGGISKATTAPFPANESKAAERTGKTSRDTVVAFSKLANLSARSLSGGAVKRSLNKA